MKLFYSIFTAFSILFMMSGCSKSEDNNDNNKTDQRITTDEIYYANQFASDALSDIYLWNKEIASDIKKLNPDTNTDPISTVKEIRYKENGKDVDKWTMLTNDYDSFTNSLKGVETTYGYDVAMGKFTNADAYFFVISFVYDGSPAQQAGLKRGDIIMKLDGKDITDANYLDALYSSKVTLGMGTDTGQGIQLGNSISLAAIKMYENPILASKIFDCNGKKVGYLAYSSFDLVSVPKLIEICKTFKAEGVKELILDLRYNGGGYVITENALASMFAPESEVKAHARCSTEIWNDGYMAYFKQKGEDINTYFATDFDVYDENQNTIKVSTADANIGLNKIYGLISSGTASASEALLIELMPFMDVDLIGTSSHGKYCTGMVLQPSDIYKNSPKSIENWGFYVMINRYADKNGNNPCMPNGLSPNTEEQDNPMDGYQLGDEQETLLKIALIKAGKTDIPTRSIASLSLPKYKTKFIPTGPLFGKRIDNRLKDKIRK